MTTCSNIHVIIQVELPFPKMAVYTNGTAFPTKNKRGEKQNRMGTTIIKMYLERMKKEVKWKLAVH